MKPTQSQLDICSRAGAIASPLQPEDRVAIAKNFRTSEWPLNGLRHPAHGNMCGWYLWRGEEFLTNPDWFEPVCYQHLIAENDPSVPYLLLPPGSRFLIAPGYEDIWHDPKVLVLEE